ncbi:MAG TPA: hypothetical protein VLJ21_01170, partial [Candidatus Binatia bacterium]|nr:hypothetical protein [Candidatus Binatia bacterium]
MTSKEYSSLRDKLEGLVLATASRITGYALRAASIAVIAAAVSYAPVRADTVRPRQEAKQEANSVEDRVRSYLDPARFESRRRIGEFTDVALKGGSVLHYHASKDAVYVDVLEDGKRVSGIGFNDATNTVIVEGIGDKSYPQATYAALRKEAVTYFEGNVPKPEPKAEKPEPTIPKAEPKPEPKQEPKQEPSRPDLEATLRAYFNPENITHRTYFTQPLKANEHRVIP